MDQCEACCAAPHLHERTWSLGQSTGSQAIAGYARPPGLYGQQVSNRDMRLRACRTSYERKMPNVD